MPEHTSDHSVPASDDSLRAIVRQVLSEYTNLEHDHQERTYKSELLEEKKRREQLEQRVNELAEENNRSRAIAEQAERHAAIRTELQKQGVQKIELAFRAVKDEIVRAEDGRLVGRTPDGEMPINEYLTGFVNENPELVPARIAGGTGMGTGMKNAKSMQSSLDLDRMRPGMDPTELARMRDEISRAALQALSGR